MINITITHLILRKIPRIIINIDVLLVIGIFASLIYLLFGKQNTTLTILTLLSLCCIFIVIFPLGNWLAVFLENRFPKLESIPTDVVGAIVLGTGFNFSVTTARNIASYNPDIGRLLAFIDLAKKYPHLRLVFTGGGRLQTLCNEADLAKKLFAQCGVNTQRIEFETAARDTNENAKFCYKMIKPQPKDKWLLVTSAMHMPRAVGLFRNLGWNIAPYPVDYHTTGKPKFINTSLLLGLYVWRYSVHEIIEMTINYIIKESQTIIPGPD